MRRPSVSAISKAIEKSHIIEEDKWGNRHYLGIDGVLYILDVPVGSSPKDKANEIRVAMKDEYNTWLTHLEKVGAVAPKIMYM